MKKAEKIYRNSETSEKALERRLVDKLKEWGVPVVKMCDPMASGMPDRLVVLPDGKVFWVEVKSVDGKLRKLQEVTFRKLQNHGHTVYLVRSETDLRMVLAMIKYQMG